MPCFAVIDTETNWVDQVMFIGTSSRTQIPSNQWLQNIIPHLGIFESKPDGVIQIAIAP